MIDICYSSYSKLELRSICKARKNIKKEKKRIKGRMRKSESSKKWEWKREKGKMNKRIKKQIFRFLSFLPFFSYLFSLLVFIRNCKWIANHKFTTLAWSMMNNSQMFSDFRDILESDKNDGNLKGIILMDKSKMSKSYFKKKNIS